MDNRISTTLKDVVDKHKEFLENPLDVYDSYTYTLEWFMCDRKTTREFQMQEAFDMETIVTDGWPRPKDNAITIAKTGVTTEFTVADLTVEAVGVGNGDLSKIAGTADKLNFTITQVGNTSLADSLQTVGALCGYKSITDAEYFMKINFVGHSPHAKKKKLDQTKVIPFKIVNYQSLNTTTDARGTTTAISGQVPADKVVMDTDVARTQHGFSYEVSGTLETVLTNFFKELNKSNLDDNDKTLDNRMKNTYSYKFSDRVKTLGWDKGTMPSDRSSDVNKNMVAKGENQAEPAEAIAPGNHIYSIVEELCQMSELIKKEIAEDNEGFTKLPKITPHLAIKPDGYNPVKGTQAYDVGFYIDYEEKVVVHNMPDQLNKIRNTKKMVEDMFANGHVNKKYEYLFTGRNDQILDFNISLDAELTKIFSTPDDIWAYEHFRNDLKKDNLEEHHQELVDKARADFVASDEQYEKQKEQTESIKKEFEDLENNYRSKIIAELAKIHGLQSPSEMRQWELDNKIGEMSLEQLMTEYAVMDDTPRAGGRSGAIKNKPRYEMIGELNISQMKKNLEAKKKAVKAANKKKSKLETTNIEKEDFANEEYAGAIATVLNERHNKELEHMGSEVFSSIRELTPDGKNLILAEELGSDLINRLSNADYELILKAQANNPVTFRRLIQGMESGTRPMTLSKGDDKEIELAREKYYEAKGGKLSMIYADMTIKGDPFWLEGYIPPVKEKEVFGDKGSDLRWNIHSKLNGFPYLVLKSGVAKGVDENDNMMTRTLILSLYAVRSITSNFTNGMFTQNLSLVKWTEAEEFTSETGEQVGMVEVEGNTNSPGHPSDPLGNLYYTPKEDNIVPIDSDIPSNVDINGDPITKNIDDYTEDEKAGKTNKITTFDTDVHDKFSNMTQEEREAAWAAQEAEELRIDEMEEAMKSYGRRTGIGQEPITTAPKNWINKNASRYVDEHADTTDDTITAQSSMVGHFNPTVDAIVRNTLANETLDQLPLLHKTCESQQKSGRLPFTACDIIKDSNKKRLESFGLTIEDQGKASTVTAMNNQINSWIANDGISFSDEEIAAYQIAAGGELNITGHDPDDIQKLVKRATFERTPQIILDEQASDITTENYYTESGVADNRILDGSKPLNSETIKGTELNTITIQPYQNSDGSIKTDEDFEAMAEEILADTNCVGACRTKKLILLGKLEQDAVKAQYKLDKIKDRKVDEIVEESCPEGTENKINIKNRKLECVPILSETLTDAEMNDVEVLKEEINKTLEENYYSESGIAEEREWKANAVELIETELKNEDLIISNEDKTALKFAAASKINNTIALNELSDNDYRKIQGYETGINTVITGSQDGHRGDLTNAVKVGKLQHELETLSADVTASNTKLDNYYFDSSHRDVEVKTLEDLELQVAISDLSLPSEKITEVATIKNGGNTTLVQINNPVDQIDVDNAPILIKSGVNTMDVILPGSLKSRYSGEGISWQYAMQNPDKIAQYNEAKKIYKILVSSDFGDMTTVTDDAGRDIKVKDFSNIGPITYTDANGVSQTISNPSTYFGIHTTTYNDINPSYAIDYDVLKGKVADLFPDIKSGQESQLINGKLPRDKDGSLVIRISGDKFYIDK